MAAGSTVLPFSRRREPRVEIRPARPGEPVARTLDEAGFGPHVARLLNYPRDSPEGEILVAVSGKRLVGGACCASFGETGWIGALGVLPRARRRGVGEQLTRAAIEWLESRGARTTMLYATDMGRPVYERVGFAHETRARAWRGVPPGPRAGTVGLRRLRPSDRRAILELDARATGEDRHAVLDMLPALLGVGFERDGVLAGVALQTPWGAGPAIMADDLEAGETVLRALAAEPQPLTITVPDDNPAGSRLLSGWGFQAVNSAQRMRYGPAVQHDPRRMFGLFNLFWG